MVADTTERAERMVEAVKTLRNSVAGLDPFARGMAAGAVVRAIRDDRVNWASLQREFESRLALSGAAGPVESRT